MIIYSDDKNLKAVVVSEVFKSSGIRRPYEDLERIQTMIDHADIVLSAWVDSKMIGIAKALKPRRT